MFVSKKDNFQESSLGMYRGGRSLLNKSHDIERARNFKKGGNRGNKKRTRKNSKNANKIRKKNRMWPMQINEETLNSCIRNQIHGKEGSFEKIIHLFEIQKESFVVRLRNFGGMTLLESILFCNKQKYSKKFLIKLISNGTPADERDLREIAQCFSPPTLKDSLIAAKVNIVQFMQESLLKFEHPDFCKEMTHPHVTLLEEISWLTGQDSPYPGSVLYDLLSNVGHFIIAARQTEKIRDIHIKAAQFFLEHPDLCPPLPMFYSH